MWKISTSFTFSFFLYREDVEALIKDINGQKEAIKKHGIWVDGRHFKVKFTGNKLPLLLVLFLMVYV